MTTLKELRIKVGIRDGFQKGVSKLANRHCYGYTKSGNGNLIINETEAETVRRIFTRYLAGYSLGKIVDDLATQGIISPTGNAKWNRQAIDKLLSNEKYVGCALLQKTLTEHGRQIRNDGQVNRFLYKNNNPAIISMETFKVVQEEKLRRYKNPKQTAGCEWIMFL
jgi:hypothetical protein